MKTRIIKLEIPSDLLPALMSALTASVKRARDAREETLSTPVDVSPTTYNSLTQVIRNAEHLVRTVADQVAEQSGSTIEPDWRKL